MGRRVRGFLVIIPAAAAVVALSLLLATCSNAFDIFSAIKTEMKIANDLFLEVKSVSPVENATLVNPGVPVVIVFDRSIDPDTANASTIEFTPALSGVSFDDYNDNTKTLSIEPLPYMDGPETYEVRITKGIKGADGSELQDEVIWSFDTRQWPAGSVSIEGGADYINTDNDVTLTISKNAAVTTFEIGNELQPDGSINVLYTGNVNTVSPYTLSSGEGTLTVYARFGDASNNYSDIETDTIFRDTVVPGVNAGSDRTITIYTTPAPPSPVWHYASTSDGAPSSGIDTYSWSLLAGAPGTITFGNASAEDTTILASADSANTSDYYTLRLTVTDNAGNTKSDDVRILWDRTPPNQPTFTTSTTTSPTLDTTPSWYWQSEGGGVGWFRRTLDGSGYTYTTGTSYTPSLAYGPHTVTVEERDIFYNYSTVASKTIYVSPDISPRWGAVNVPTNPTLSWPSAGLKYTYKVYFGVAGKRLNQIYSGLGTSTTLPANLDYLTTYEWYYTATYFLNTTRYPAGKDYYSFRTIFKFKF